MAQFIIGSIVAANAALTVLRFQRDSIIGDRFLRINCVILPLSGWWWWISFRSFEAPSIHQELQPQWCAKESVEWFSRLSTPEERTTQSEEQTVTRRVGHEHLLLVADPACAELMSKLDGVSW
jgi:cytoskeletal protein RodZ